VKGARFVRADLHVHTFPDGGSVAPDLSEYVRIARERDVEVLGVMRSRARSPRGHVCCSRTSQPPISTGSQVGSSSSSFSRRRASRVRRSLLQVTTRIWLPPRTRASPWGHMKCGRPRLCPAAAPRPGKATRAATAGPAARGTSGPPRERVSRASRYHTNVSS
jgi:hypothetical protein